MPVRMTASRAAQSPPTREAGTELRHIRQRLGWTQRAFADQLAVHYDTLGAWERGMHEPPLMALRLARFLLLSIPPSRQFISDAIDRSQSVRASPGVRCLWRDNDAVACGGRLYRVQAQLSRRRHLISETCETHLHSAFASIYFRLDTATKDEARRQAGCQRKRLERLRAHTRAAAAGQ